MFNPFTLEGKTILITGASSGIGRQCAIDCSKMGAKVVLVARNQARLDETLSLMKGEGHKAYSFDLEQLAGIKDLMALIVAENGKLDGFIHAAGIEKTAPIKLLSPDDYDAVYKTNCLSAFEIVKNLGLKQINAEASIVFIASISGVIARTGLAAYSASKGALISASKVMALEFAKRKIRVNTVSPGTILTPMMEKALNEMPEEDRVKRVEGFPLGLGETTDISNACIYLLSDAAKWVTGQNLIVDGGYTAR